MGSIDFSALIDFIKAILKILEAIPGMLKDLFSKETTTAQATTKPKDPLA